VQDLIIKLFAIVGLKTANGTLELSLNKGTERNDN